jgi:hypothetical protein
MRGAISEAAQASGFRPFNLNITVENEADLVALWARFNMSGEVLAPAAQARAIAGSKGAFSREFYDRLLVDPDGKKQVYKLLTDKLQAAGIARR